MASQDRPRFFGSSGSGIELLFALDRSRKTFEEEEQKRDHERHEQEKLKTLKQEVTKTLGFGHEVRDKECHDHPVRLSRAVATPQLVEKGARKYQMQEKSMQGWGVGTTAKQSQASQALQEPGRTSAAHANTAQNRTKKSASGEQSPKPGPALSQETDYGDFDATDLLENFGAYFGLEGDDLELDDNDF